MLDITFEEFYEPFLAYAESKTKKKTTLRFFKESVEELYSILDRLAFDVTDKYSFEEGEFFIEEVLHVGLKFHPQHRYFEEVYTILLHEMANSIHITYWNELDDKSCWVAYLNFVLERRIEEADLKEAVDLARRLSVHYAKLPSESKEILNTYFDSMRKTT